MSIFDELTPEEREQAITNRIDGAIKLLRKAKKAYHTPDILEDSIREAISKLEIAEKLSETRPGRMEVQNECTAKRLFYPTKTSK